MEFNSMPPRSYQLIEVSAPPINNEQAVLRAIRNGIVQKALDIVKSQKRGVIMNYWTELSIQFANQRNYLDELFRVYPMNPEGIREIDKGAWENIEKYFNKRDNLNLIKSLLALELFPIKDSYVAYLKRDTGALERNPDTINRLCGRIYEIGIAKIFERCSQPIETNRQIGPLFKNWLKNGGLGIQPTSIENFQRGDGNAILDASDNEMKNWCETNLDYRRDKGLDFVGRFNGNYVIGEAKFLTDFGGHQYAQFDDAISTISDPTKKAVKIAILDGVLYIPSNNKMYRQLSTIHSEKNIFSALVLREFLYSL